MHIHISSKCALEPSLIFQVTLCPNGFRLDLQHHANTKTHAYTSLYINMYTYVYIFFVCVSDVYTHSIQAIIYVDTYIHTDEIL